MTEPRYVTRRATMEDLPQLLELWRLEQLPAAELEKRFTEFQVVSDESGQVLAALGVQLIGAQAVLHSEAIARPELSDSLRERLWKRLQVIIQNHALERLWTQLNANFWRDQGFARAEEEQLKALPPGVERGDRSWQSVTLRAADANAALEREFAQIRTLQQEETARLQSRVVWMKRIALSITVIVFLLVVAWAVVMLKLGPKLFRGQ